MRRGFQCADGWFILIWKLCEKLEPLVAEWERMTGSHFEVLQVKEKFGGLRFYTSGGNEEIHGCIRAAELKSLCTCEECGKLGRLRKRIHGTLCDTCMAELLAASVSLKAVGDK